MSSDLQRAGELLRAGVQSAVEYPLRDAVPNRLGRLSAAGCPPLQGTQVYSPVLRCRAQAAASGCYGIDRANVKLFMTRNKGGIASVSLVPFWGRGFFLFFILYVRRRLTACSA